MSGELSPEGGARELFTGHVRRHTAENSQLVALQPSVRQVDAVRDEDVGSRAAVDSFIYKVKLFLYCSVGLTGSSLFSGFLSE